MAEHNLKVYLIHYLKKNNLNYINPFLKGEQMKESVF